MARCVASAFAELFANRFLPFTVICFSVIVTEVMLAKSLCFASLTPRPDDVPSLLNLGSPKETPVFPFGVVFFVDVAGFCVRVRLLPVGFDTGFFADVVFFVFPRFAAVLDARLTGFLTAADVADFFVRVRLLPVFFGIAFFADGVFFVPFFVSVFVCFMFFYSSVFNFFLKSD